MGVCPKWASSNEISSYKEVWRLEAREIREITSRIRVQLEGDSLLLTLKMEKLSGNECRWLLGTKSSIQLMSNKALGPQSYSLRKSLVPML